MGALPIVRNVATERWIMPSQRLKGRVVPKRHFIMESQVESERPARERDDSPAKMGSGRYFFGGEAANCEPRTHMRPRESCQSFSVECRWPMARATVRKL